VFHTNRKNHFSTNLAIIPKRKSPTTIEKPKTHTKSLKQAAPKLECRWGTFGNKNKPNQTTHRRARNEGKDNTM